MRNVRTVVRTLIAGFLALAALVLAAPAMLAHAQEVQQQSSRTNGASSSQITVSITAVNHSFATPTSTVTLSGTIANHTGKALSGVQVQLLTSAQFFVTREDMDGYAAGTSSNYVPYPVGTADVLKGTLHAGATAHWSASFSTSGLGFNLSQIGVYPLAAQAEAADGTPIGIDRTFLPFWPGKGAADPLSTAWVWPLIGLPQQGPCPQTVATNKLAASLGTGGRLGTLLAVGRLWGQRDRLTWAVDPALLSDTSVMSRAYKVGTNSTCTGKHHMPSTPAAAWLSSLRTGTASQQMFVTPYADADAAALSHAGLDGNLRDAYQLGESVATQMLSRPFGTNSVAWPTDGIADASTLTSLAGNGISTVVLNSDQLGSTTAPRDNAITATATGTGNRMGVLLADSGLTGILASASPGSPASAQFTAEQDFLAQTAMIAAEAPFQRRSLVIAPPRTWDPPSSEAAKLLSETYSAPWLRKVDIASLATAADRLKPHQQLTPYRVKADELGKSYLDGVESVNANVATYQDLLYRPAPALLRQLDEAAAVLTSTAWRGNGSNPGWTALIKLADYLSYSEKKVQILTGTKLLLAGSSGPAPVSVQNAGQLPVQVKITVTVPANSQLSVANIGPPVIVQPGKTRTVRMTVHSSGIGTTQLRLQLVTKNGSPLPWTSVSLSVQATRYGRALLVLIGAALGVLVLASVARWIRRLNGARADGRSGGTR
jgi:Family of unknown function (DUF6049)